MITTLLIIHGLLAVTLLGALSHQTMALWWGGGAAPTLAARVTAGRPPI
jgi:hypothetical protein